MENYLRATYRDHHSSLNGKIIVVKEKIEKVVDYRTRVGGKLKKLKLYYYVGWFLNDLVNNSFEFEKGIRFNECEVRF